MLQASTNNAPLLENGVDGSGNLRNTTVSETSRGSTGSKRPKEAERYGLTSQQAIDLREEWGYNELPTIVLPLWYIFFVQFTGTMPYMLEIACGKILCSLHTNPDYLYSPFMLTHLSHIHN